MKIQLYSDLHLEMMGFYFIPQTDADVIVLAGDIGVGLDGIEWAIDLSEKHECPVIYVAGNHEFYKHDYHELLLEMRKLAAKCKNVYLLEKDEVVINGVRFLGTTLWTNYLAVTGVSQAGTMFKVGRALNDHRLIRFNDDYFKPSDALMLNEESVAWLEEKLAVPFDGKTVVVTHHGPSLKCAHPSYAIDEISAGFVSYLDHLVVQANVWCFGHTHSSLDTTVGKCRLISNQKGYPREMMPVAFNEDLLIDV